MYFNDSKLVERVGILDNGVLFCKSRLTDDQSLRAVGGLENVVDLESFTGVNFRVPVIDKFSPVAISIANHLHFEVYRHKGTETLHLLSLQHVKIIGGRILIYPDCVLGQVYLHRPSPDLGRFPIWGEGRSHLRVRFKNRLFCCVVLFSIALAFFTN